MCRAWLLWAVVSSLASGEVLPAPASGDANSIPSALTIGPDLGTGAITIRGRNARQQLFVTGVGASGELRDFTHGVSYSAVPDDVVAVDA